MTQLSLTPAGVSLRELLADELRGDLAARPPRDQLHERLAASAAGRRVRRRHRTPTTTGMTMLTQAAERGAAAVICERPLPVFDVPQCVVADSRAAYGRLCQALVGDPSRQMKVIGVTGTHGKTTVARLLTSIFRAGGQPRPARSIRSATGTAGKTVPRSTDRLSPPLLARSLAQMAAAGASHAVVEVSSRELSQQVLAGVTLDAVCMTQVGRDHLDWHGSVENYRQAKRRIFDHLHADGVAILNADDPVSRANAERSRISRR